jgi:hypothetical protein
MNNPLPSHIRLAVDTEFHGPLTLTVQVAARLGPDRLAVQMYHHEMLPCQPADCEPDFSVAGYRARFTRLEIRPFKVLTSNLSPGAMITDILGIDGFESFSRSAAHGFIRSIGVPPDRDTVHPEYRNVRWNGKKQIWQVPEVNLTIIGHFLRADICRMFGWKFVNDMRSGTHGVQPVHLADGKVLRYSDSGRWSGGTILEYLARPGELYAIRVSFADTSLPFGRASLDGLSQTFLGVGKSQQIADDEKAKMADAFRSKPAEAYRYAIVDAVNTLLVHEEMEAEDQRLSSKLGIAPCGPSAMPGTLGARVARIVIADAQRTFGPVARSPIRDLMRAGGRTLNLAPHASKFGEQLLSVHGGLLYTRSPTTFWHESPGQLRDADLKACYSTALAGMNVYLGRPVVFEPGASAMTLRAAVDFARRHADDDAWLMRVSGDFERGLNALIPSTEDAITSESFRSSVRKAAAIDGNQNTKERTAGARLYTRTVRYGVVTAATWQAIEMLPKALRSEYEKLTVDTMMLYPRKMIAATADEYADLASRYASGEVPWDQVLDLERDLVTETRSIGAEFVSYRYPIKELMEKLAELRQEARTTQGKGSGAEMSAKATANTVYGVLASKHKATFNVMAANQVTAIARAIVFITGQSLNAIQTITDGCTYRADQVPSMTFEETLKALPSYLIRRADSDSGIRFRRKSKIPTEDKAFDEWLRQHVARFFSVSRMQVDALFGQHAIEHKADGNGAICFDALGCDGAGNYIKCSKSPKGAWDVLASGLRGYRKKAKGDLIPFLVAAYSSDNLTGLTPIVEDDDLLGANQAMAEVRAWLAEFHGETRFPLGFNRLRVKNFKIFKLSGFLFQTPEQRRKTERQFKAFEEEYWCGLELLALRRGYGNRRTGSISGLADEIYRHIASGKHRLMRLFNADHLGENLRRIATDRRAEIDRRRSAANSTLRDQMHVPNTFTGREDWPTDVRISLENMDFLQTGRRYRS